MPGAMQHDLIDEIRGRPENVPLVEAPDVMGQPLGRVGGEMIGAAIRAVLRPQTAHHPRLENITHDQSGGRRHVAL